METTQVCVSTHSTESYQLKAIEQYLPVVMFILQFYKVEFSEFCALGKRFWKVL